MAEFSTSNYNKVRDEWRRRFLEMDHEALIKRFHLKADEQTLYIEYFSRLYRIDRINGEITDEEEPDRVLPFNTVIGFYNMFHYAIDAPCASGTLVPFRKVKRVYPFETAYKNTVLRELETAFAGKLAQLDAACRQLSGIKMKQGDVGYTIPVFPFLSIAILFWDEDDEFSAQANMLFDSHITDFMHEENVVGIASDAVYYLKLAANLNTKAVYGK